MERRKKPARSARSRLRASTSVPEFVSSRWIASATGVGAPGYSSAISAHLPKVLPLGE